MPKTETEQLVEDIARHVNSMSRDSKEFCELMANEHRTLQQSFTRLCMEWVIYCASDEYRTDLRNEATKTLAKEIVNAQFHLNLPLI